MGRTHSLWWWTRCYDRTGIRNFHNRVRVHVPEMYHFSHNTSQRCGISSIPGQHIWRWRLIHPKLCRHHLFSGSELPHNQLLPFYVLYYLPLLIGLFGGENLSSAQIKSDGCLVWLTKSSRLFSAIYMDYTSLDMLCVYATCSTCGVSSCTYM